MSNTPSIIERHQKDIVGVLGCFDRIIITGTLPDCGHAGAMTAQLVHRKVKIFDYPSLVDPLRNQLHENAKRLAVEAGIEIEALRSYKDFRKEDRIAEIIERRGTHPGLVHIFSAMESCNCFKPWHDRATGKTSLRPSPGRCAHLYFYFIDKLLGLCYLRVPTWAPFRLQFYCNGHNWLASLLQRSKVGFEMHSNAFVQIDDFAKAQELSDSLHPDVLHRRLDQWARQFCPVHHEFPSGWHWNLMQVEYATDIIFKEAARLAPLYDTLLERAVLQVKADDIATFLGRNGLNPNYQGEGGSRYGVLIEGRRVRHNLGDASIKMYDKFGHILRIETTANDVSFFKHRREVVHQDGGAEMKNAPVKKTIHSLGIVRELMAASNRRYLGFLSALVQDDDPDVRQKLDRVSNPVRDDAGRSHRGVNLFAKDDLDLVTTVMRGEYAISGFTVRRLRPHLPGWDGGRISRAIRRLREHGLVKKIGGTFKYYATKIGLSVLAAGLRLREETIIPAFSQLVAV